MASPAGQGTETLARLVGVLFALIGLVLLVGAGFYGVNTCHFIRTAARTTGVVTGFTTTGGAHPEVQFMTVGGPVVCHPATDFVFGLRAGGRVPLLYDPRDPASTAALDAPGALWGGVGALSFLGAAFCGLGLARALGSKMVYVRGIEQ